MDIVVGSGPSGLAVTTALLARGRRVTMLDGGETLDAAALAHQKTMASTPPNAWTQTQIEDWQAPQFASEPGLSRRYGSDHAQLAPERTLADNSNWFALRASHAVGGLSNVWGAAVLPSRQSDIKDWPIQTDDLAPHYKAVMELMPISGRQDRLEQLFPAASMAGKTALKPGPQGQRLLEKLDNLGEAFASDGVHVGQARQAIANNCQYCGMCLHGCPWNQIFSARHGLERLQDNPNFTYRPGRLVKCYSESGSGVELHLKDGTSIQGERLFLGAGVLETARIVLSSQPAPDQTLTLRDSQHFFLPFLHSWKADGHPENDPHHTLTEAFIEIDDPHVSPYLTHTQIYGWNEFYAREMIAKYGSKLPGSGPLFRALSRRLMVAQTFLHSDHSATIDLTLGHGEPRLSVTRNDNPETDTVINAAKSKLAKTLRRAGLYALTFAARAGAPGSSFHSGATLPMSASPTRLQTDISGRLAGSNRVHVVDASVLPSIPATTITFTVMANAHRIGTLA